MAIKDALFTQLSGYAGLSALVGSRIYPMKLPQNPTLPAVSYFTVFTEREYGHGGAMGQATPLIQIDAWADDYDEAKSVATQVRLAMNRFIGTVASVVVHASTCVSERDLYEDDTGNHHVALEFEVVHQEAA